MNELEKSVENKIKRLKTLNVKELNELCDELRKMLLDVISKNGGHLASNLGAVELTVALHKVFDCPKDQIVWDVGHQSYVHKILTGRLDRFKTIRKENGISGFSKPSESQYDAFISGHAGVSISAAYGLAVAKKLKHDDGYVISVTGDGAFSNGTIYEAMNNAGRGKEKLIIVLNDNGMSISKNESALARYLTHIRTSNGYFKTKNAVSKMLTDIPCVGEPLKNLVSKTKDRIKDGIYGSNLFEDLGFTYLGPIDGHNIESLCDIFERTKTLNKPVVVHINTRKGLGYGYAEENPTAYHGVGSFNKESGLSSSGNNFSAVFGHKLEKMAEENPKICAVTAAMCDGTGLCGFASKFKSKGRFFDVGIAEGHGMSFSAALAAGGMIPVYAIYSTFLQRAYDQMIHDISIEKIHVVLGIDRSGVVGDDGETHQGLFDVAMLKSIPGSTIYSPSNYEELEKTMELAVNGTGLCGVRYPRGGENEYCKNYHTNNINGDLIEEGKDTLLVSYGRIWGNVLKADEKLKERGVNVSKLKLTRIWPIDENIVKKASEYKNVIFYEEAAQCGGIGESFGIMLMENNFKGKYLNRGITNFVPQATMDRSLEKLKLDSESMVEDVLK